MHARFLTALVLGPVGAFLVVASQVFASATTAWIAFGIGIGALVFATVPALFGDRSSYGLTLDVFLGLLAAWTIVASLVYTGSTLTWLALGEGAAFVAVSAAGLVLNEVRWSRTVPATTTATTSLPRPSAAA